MHTPSELSSQEKFHCCYTSMEIKCNIVDNSVLILRYGIDIEHPWRYHILSTINSVMNSG